MVLMATDFPEPVVPATRACGILARSATIGVPELSFPIASVSNDFDLTKGADDINSRRQTISRSRLGISRPITDLPGITSTMRTLVTDSALARSFAKVLMHGSETPFFRYQNSI